MDFGEKKSRIYHVNLQNIALSNKQKPLQEANNFFSRLKRNTTVLTRLRDSEDKRVVVSQSCELIGQGMSGQKTRLDQIISLNKHKNSRYSNHSLQQINKSIKVNANKCIFPQIHHSKQLTHRSPSRNLVFDQNTYLSRNQIQSSWIGKQSSSEILKKYEDKRLRQQLQRKQALTNYISSLKISQQDIDDEDQEEKATQRRKILIQKSLRLERNHQHQQVGLTESQHKLKELLGNRFTDRDFIDYNVKLFEKRDVNKKKFFQRYHNILKTQRESITIK